MVSFIFPEVDPSFDFPMGFGFGWGFSDDPELFSPLGFGPALLFLTFFHPSPSSLSSGYTFRVVPLEMAVLVIVFAFERELLII